ncbi:deoxycytidylate deaminase-like [Mya arenaria]|uniref:deoxycytidylate deaminase-like n=1 Tax=Mya arenaria TaxID=6604 RepID=UPI0022E39916|nr:deoxycytidylate deaminase-like [Mya arenaria]
MTNYTVGACIVNEDKRIVSTGYNGMPNRCPDDKLPWGKGDKDDLKNKKLYVCHAELNAVLNKNSTDVKNCTIYMSLFPCNECAKVIIQSGIKEIKYYSDKYKDRSDVKASKSMLDMAEVRYSQYLPTRGKIEIDFSVIEEMSKGAYNESQGDTRTTRKRKLDD